MTHDELLAKIYSKEENYYADTPTLAALRAVVELHKPDDDSFCGICTWSYPCITVQAIEKELG